MVYALWCGVGIVGTAVLAYFVYGQKLSLPTLGDIFSAGDLDAYSTARMPSVEGTANMSTQVVDKATLDVGFGVSMAKDNLRFALEYDLQVSDNRTAHGVMGIVEFKF